jgi:hypothetical protein
MGRKSSILTLIAVGSATAFRIPCTNHRNARILLKDSSRTGDYVALPATTMSTTTKSAQKTVVSPALPFLECPATLVNSDLAGNVGFDPIGFSKSTEELLAYREAEVKHGRLAMLVRNAKVFWVPVGQTFHAPNLIVVIISLINTGICRMARFRTNGWKDCRKREYAFAAR